MGNFKEINIENGIYYYFHDMINIKNFDSNLLKICKKSYQNVDIYYIRYITIKYSDYVKINSVNPLYLIIDKADGCIKCNSMEEKNENKYLTLATADKNKEALIKYANIQDKIKDLIKKVNGGEPGEYGTDFIKIKLNSDDNLRSKKY